MMRPRSEPSDEQKARERLNEILGREMSDRDLEAAKCETIEQWRAVRATRKK
jgi:hypothetical protein